MANLDTSQQSSLQQTTSREAQAAAHGHNVGETERLLSLIGGSALALWGLSRRTPGGLGLALLGGGLIYRGATGHCNLYASLGVSTAERHGAQTTIPAEAGVKVERGIVVMRPAQELYHFWRDFENLPRIMRHLESVRVLTPTRSHWVAEGPLGLRFEWDADIISEKENTLIGWRSLPGSAVDTAGSVHFTPQRDGSSTEVKVVLKYNPPAGKVGAAIAGLMGQSPDRQIEEDLRTFKWVMEFGRLSQLPRP
jgi:uncharacterized membrane protein